MFISKINLYANPSNIYNNKINSQKTSQKAECGFISSPLEILGRSQVTFRGNNFKLNSDDKKFVDVVSRDLRFSDEQKELFSEIVKDYLKENKLKSLEEMNGDDNNAQSYFLNKVSEKMDLSDTEFDVLAFHIIDRIYCDGVYLPDDRRFIKDLPLIEPILEKYGLDEDAVDTVTDAMFIDADNFKCNALFDIFNQHANEIEDTIFFGALSDELCDDDVTNVIIDLSIKSKQYEKEGENIFRKNQERAKFYNTIDDEFITDGILDEFNIAEEEGENIFKHVIKRYADISLQQIAFEIADEYNLPPKADKKIIEIIQNQISIREKLYDSGENHDY